MAGKKEIEITINTDGTVEAEAFGYKGKGCSEDIDEIMKNVGRTVKSKKKTGYRDQQRVRTSQHDG